MNFPVILSQGEYYCFVADGLSWNSCFASVIDCQDNTTVAPVVRDGGILKVKLNGSPIDISNRIVRLFDCDGNEVYRLHDPFWSYDSHFTHVVIFPTAPDGVTYINKLEGGDYTVRIDGINLVLNAKVIDGKINEVVVEIESD